MTGTDDIKSESAALKSQLRHVHGLRGRNLGQAVQRGKRKLPRHVRKDGQQVAEALGKLGNPKLERTVDMKQVRAAQSRVKAQLSTVDVADTRRGFRLGMAGTIAFNILLVALIFFGWMAYTGRI